MKNIVRHNYIFGKTEGGFSDSEGWRTVLRR